MRNCPRSRNLNLTKSIWGTILGALELSRAQCSSYFSAVGTGFEVWRQNDRHSVRHAEPKKDKVSPCIHLGKVNINKKRCEMDF